MRRIIIGIVAVLAIGAAAASSASAKMTVELRTAKGPVIPGQELVLSSSNVYFSVGEIECSANARMQVGNSNGPGSITGLSLYGNAPGEPCNSAFGAAGLAVRELPSSITFTASRKGGGKINGSVVISTGGPLRVVSTFHGKSTNPELDITAKTLKGTFPIGEPVVITMTEQKVVNKGMVVGNITINGGGRMSATWTLTSAEGEPVEASVKR
jgi:hypothetical protein